MTVKIKGGKEKTIYYHDAVAAAIVAPGNSVVLPLAHEMVSNEDGEEKQDCERNAAKRWFVREGSKLKDLNPVFLGADLYCCHSICSQIVELGYSFIFTCKEEIFNTAPDHLPRRTGKQVVRRVAIDLELSAFN